jgi:hypothetical protein
LLVSELESFLTIKHNRKGGYKNMIDEKKLLEWRKWGKEAYASNANMMKNNSHHPDYKTEEQREAVHDNFADSYILSEKRKEVLLSSKFNYTEEDYSKAVEAFKDGYNASRQWYKRADMKYQAIIDKYMPIFKEAEAIANSVDVSDIKDGFPCGSAHLYLQKYAEAEDLYKAIGHFSTSSTDVFKYELPLKMPTYGQCVSFDERVCEKVNEFLRSKGIFASVYSWID